MRMLTSPNTEKVLYTPLNIFYLIFYLIFCSLFPVYFDWCGECVIVTSVAKSVTMLPWIKIVKLLCAEGRWLCCLLCLSVDPNLKELKGYYLNVTLL